MLAMCVMRQNWKELPAFIKLCNELNAAAVLHKVWSPTEFALFNLPFPALEDIQSELSTFTFKHSNSLEKQNYETFNYFLSVIRKWKDNAEEKTENINEISSMNTQQILTLFLLKIEQAIDIMPIEFEDKVSSKKIFRSRFDKILASLNTLEQLLLLKQLYVENPQQIIDGVKQLSDEKIYDNIKLILRSAEA